MTHKQNSSNNGWLSEMHTHLVAIKQELDNAYSNCMNLTEDQYPEVYYLRGIFMNLQAIISEVDKGVQGGFISQDYFDEKTDSLLKDLEGLVKIHRDNVSVHFSSTVKQIKSEYDLK